MWAGEKKLPLEQTSNELVDLSATALVDRDQIRQELGSGLGNGFIVVRVTLRPVSDKAVVISHDDFLLVDDHQGERSRPFEPSQIAGPSALVVSSTAGHGGGMAGQNTGPSFGGLGGMGRRPGNGGGVGNTAETAPLETKVESTDGKASPVLAALKEKVLPEKSITDPVSGLLYFLIDGKVKSKDLRLTYKTPAGKLELRFR
jgi:hypothetical protein